jgi:hypothetical protein
MEDEIFNIQLDFGGGAFEAEVIGTKIPGIESATYAILVNGVRIAQLQMKVTDWITTYGELDQETINYLGNQIENHYN